jgi:hypothetical protein
MWLERLSRDGGVKQRIERMTEMKRATDGVKIIKCGEVHYNTYDPMALIFGPWWGNLIFPYTKRHPLFMVSSSN